MSPAAEAYGKCRSPIDIEILEDYDKTSTEIVRATPSKRKVVNMARDDASCERDLSDMMCDFMEDHQEVLKETRKRRQEMLTLDKDRFTSEKKHREDRLKLNEGKMALKQTRGG